MNKKEEPSDDVVAIGGCDVSLSAQHQEQKAEEDEKEKKEAPARTLAAAAAPTPRPTTSVAGDTTASATNNTRAYSNTADDAGQEHHDHNNDNNNNKRKRSSSTRIRRSVCRRCERPLVTCLCASLPERPLTLKRCHCLVLQHPHELQRKNRSLPLVQLCLDSSSLTVLVSRRLYNNQEERDPAVLQLLEKLQQQRDDDDEHLLWLIYPHPDAIPLRQAIQQLPPPPPPPTTSYYNNDNNNNHQKVTLLFLDATWKYSQEMDRYHEARDMYPDHMLRVKLDSTDISNLTIKRRFAIRTPKSDEHLSTAECLAYTISRIEGEEKVNASSCGFDGSSIYQTIMKPLDCMVEQWKSFQQRDKQGKDTTTTTTTDDDDDNNHNHNKSNGE